LVERLARIGLTPSEARVYVALLGMRLATAAELAEAAHVPRPKAYAALRTLEQRGFCTTLGGPVARFQPVAPESALRGWVNQRDDERELLSENEHALAAELTTLLPALGDRRDTTAVTYVESVSGRSRTTETFERLANGAEHRLLVVHQPPFLQPPSRWNLAEIDALGRGVKVQVIFSADSLTDERRYVPLLDAGAAPRVLDRPSMKLVLRDHGEAMIALRDPITGEQGLTSAIIRHPDLVNALELLFSKEWRTAKQLDSVIHPGRKKPRRAERDTARQGSER
jgi:sugar-specific transcriptional regulator TrmB